MLTTRRGRHILMWGVVLGLVVGVGVMSAAQNQILPFELERYLELQKELFRYIWAKDPLTEADYARIDQMELERKRLEPFAFDWIKDQLDLVVTQEFGEEALAEVILSPGDSDIQVIVTPTLEPILVGFGRINGSLDVRTLRDVIWLIKRNPTTPEIQGLDRLLEVEIFLPVPLVPEMRRAFEGAIEDGSTLQLWRRQIGDLLQTWISEGFALDEGIGNLRNGYVNATMLAIDEVLRDNAARGYQNIPAEPLFEVLASPAVAGFTRITDRFPVVLTTKTSWRIYSLLSTAFHEFVHDYQINNRMPITVYEARSQQDLIEWITLVEMSASLGENRLTAAYEEMISGDLLKRWEDEKEFIIEAVEVHSALINRVVAAYTEGSFRTVKALLDELTQWRQDHDYARPKFTMAHVIAYLSPQPIYDNRETIGQRIRYINDVLPTTKEFVDTMGKVNSRERLDEIYFTLKRSGGR
ncbi:MAG: hypothetical protein ACE5JP_07655 [Candidatus Bipolaricaulia bacterium]